MESSILEEIGIDPIVYIVVRFIIVVILAVLFIVQTNRLKKMEQRLRGSISG